MASRAQLVEELLQLSSQERARAAKELLVSLDDTDNPDDVEAAWASEIERRVRDIESGAVELKDGPTVMSAARERLRSRRGD